MEPTILLSNFFGAIDHDPRINTTHISIFVSLVQFYQLNKSVNPIRAFSHQIKALSKVSGNGTYLKSIKDLHNYGYIKYVPSFNKNEGSEVYLL